MCIRTLQYWHKLEHFYPYVIGEQNHPNIDSFKINSHDRFETILAVPLSGGKAVRYYVVYLGVFRVDRALDALEQGFGQEMRFRDDSEDTSCFCQFNLTADFEFNADSFRISSFPWAIHRVRDGKITIDSWDEDFHAFESDVFLRLYNRCEAFDYDFLCELRDELAKLMNWSVAYCDH
ncbi:MAG: hypothetical protein LBS24_03830, partial [Clostridiales Family XIII bacterium]|nr:hypothetical protein [Clostridiales Family XIII bacterium]